MTKIKLIALAVLLRCLAYSQAAYIQKSYVEGLSGTTITSTALSSTVIGGNAIIGFVWFISGAGPITSITTSQGNSCVVVSGSSVTTSVFTQGIYYCASVTGGSSYTVTANLTGSSGFSAIYASEYSGITGIDLGSNGKGANATSISLPWALTPQHNADLLFGSAIIYGGSPSSDFTPVSPYTLRWPTSSAFSGVADWIQTTATATTGVFTSGETTEWGLSVVAFRTTSDNNPYVISYAAVEHSGALSSHSTPSFNKTGASALLVFIGSHDPWSGNSVSIASVSDTAGSTWVLASGPTVWVGSIFPLLGAVYYALSPPAGSSDVVTVTVTNAAPMVIQAYAIGNSSGVPVVSALNSPVTGGTDTSVTAGPISASQNSLLISLAKNENDATATPATGWGLDPTDGVRFMWPAHKVAPTTSTYSAAFTYDALIGWQAFIASFGPNLTNGVSSGGKGIFGGKGSIK